MSFSETGPTQDLGAEAAEQQKENGNEGRFEAVKKELVTQEATTAKNDLATIIRTNSDLKNSEIAQLENTILDVIDNETDKMTDTLIQLEATQTEDLLVEMSNKQQELIQMLREMSGNLQTELDEKSGLLGHISDREFEELLTNADQLIPIERRGASPADRAAMASHSPTLLARLPDFSHHIEQAAEWAGSQIDDATEKLGDIGKKDAYRDAEKRYDSGDQFVAAEIYADIKELCNSTTNSKERLRLVKEKYGEMTPFGTSPANLAGAVLSQIGIKGEDLKRAFAGLPTLENMDLNLSTQEVDEIKSALLPETITNQIVKASTGQSELTGYQKVMLTPANAIEGVAQGFLDLPETIQALSKMGEELADSPELREMGIKGDLIIAIIDQYFSAAEKVAFIGQFVAEGMVSGGIGSVAGKLSKIPRINETLIALSKLKFAKPLTATAKTVINVGTSRTTTRGMELSTTEVETSEDSDKIG